MKVLTFVVHLSQEVVKVLHGSEERVDGPEIFHIIAEVPHGRAVERTDRHGLDVQVLEVIQLLLNTCQTRDTTVMKTGYWTTWRQYKAEGKEASNVLPFCT